MGLGYTLRTMTIGLALLLPGQGAFADTASVAVGAGEGGYQSAAGISMFPPYQFPPDTPSLEERLDIDPVERSKGIYAQAIEWPLNRIELYECGEGEMCGRLVWLYRMAEPDGSERLDAKNPDPDLRDRRLIGLEVLTGLTQKKEGRWTGGEIYNANDGKSYRAAINFEKDGSVELKACFLFLCEEQDWVPAEIPDQEDLPGPEKVLGE